MSFCPHREPFMVGGVPFTARAVIEGLEPFLLEERGQRIREVIAARTYSVVPVMEGLYDRGNVSAVLRSAEALGFQAVHIVDSSEAFKQANRVTQGAEKWLDIRVWGATPACVDALRAQGYRILATHFEDAQPIDEVDFTVPTALFFGNEKEGVSRELLDRADGRVVIPMAGFTRSFNISVAAALGLFHIQEDRKRRLGRQGDLTDREQELLTASYFLRSVASAQAILLERRARRGPG
jgi:tRNA (guanosine-2'-O-)-methyltransferase